MESVRINKYLSEAGICSRREADRQLEAGNIYINNQMAKPGDRVNPGDEVRVNGQVVHRKEAPVLKAEFTSIWKMTRDKVNKALDPDACERLPRGARNARTCSRR